MKIITLILFFLVMSCSREETIFVERNSSSNFIVLAMSGNNEYLNSILITTESSVRVSRNDLTLLRYNMIYNDDNQYLIELINQSINGFKMESYYAIMPRDESEIYKNLIVMKKGLNKFLIQNDGLANILRETISTDSVYFVSSPMLFNGKDTSEITIQEYYSAAVKNLVTNRALVQFGERADTLLIVE